MSEPSEHFTDIVFAPGQKISFLRSQWELVEISERFVVLKAKTSTTLSVMSNKVKTEKRTVREGEQ